MKVNVWSEQITIPTYEVGVAEKNPMFLEKRVYQGSSGVVYPYPVIEKIADEPTDKSYNALWLENEYVKIMILPELGGRVQMAYDKIKQRHFVYYNHVIKPALVGLAGPWISGGIEFNWPQHHRPSTYMPVDWSIEEHEDGSATVWVSERERMFHQRGAAGFTLHPGSVLLEIKGRVYNPTQLPQTFLWWANPAVAVNDDYQSVFPSDVNAVFDHGKRDVSSFPIATGIYYKMDYSPGTDISRYRNIPVPTSYMAIASKYDFVGGYENDTRAGLLHVANHHVSPGKKQWTWGCGDFGKAWDRNLTDEDGPYIELMTGVFTDNQPDFTWLQPYEEKTFTQYFLPYRELGVVKNANSDLLLNLEAEHGTATVKVFATSKQSDVRVVLNGSECYYDKIHTLTPENVLTETVKIGNDKLEDLHIVLYKNGREALSWKYEAVSAQIPDPAQAVRDPQEIETCEELYLAGLHLEQYRHATYDPTAYYKEALRRDASDVRNNNALGLWLLRRGRFTEAEGYFRAAIKRQLERNPNPYDGEPFYNLGLSLKYQGHMDEAYRNFYKACWNGAWQDSGYFSLAQISTLKGNYSEALFEIDKSLSRNTGNMLALHLKIALLRKTNRIQEAKELIGKVLVSEKFNFGALYERYLISGSESDRTAMVEIMRRDSHNYEELALDYMNAGLMEECIGVLRIAIDVCTRVSPMVYYYIGYAGNDLEAFRTAASCDPSYCFPNRLEAILALTRALELNPSDAKACYYLGNLWYDKRQYDLAYDCWQRSVGLDGTFPTALRNLALISFNKLGKCAEAVDLMERAFALDRTDARVLMELDQLYKRIQKPHGERKTFLETEFENVIKRDDLYLEFATLLNQLGEYAEAKAMIDSRKFHPWEGGEGKVPAQYQISRVGLARMALCEGRCDDAVALLKECYVYPHNLGEGKLQGAQENDFNYWMGRALEAKGDTDDARRFYTLACAGISEPCDAIYYNDQKPDKIFYQGLAWNKLGGREEAEKRFNRLIEYGRENMDRKVKIDYFAVSLPDILIWEDDLDRRNKVHCHYMMGLGYLGLGDISSAVEHLQAAAKLDMNHQGVQCHLAMAQLGY